jgi:hypothetical protein
MKKFVLIFLLSVGFSLFSKQTVKAEILDPISSATVFNDINGEPYDEYGYGYIKDSSGNTFIAWVKNTITSPGNASHALQLIKIKPDNSREWGVNPITVFTNYDISASNTQHFIFGPQLLSDGAGGVFVLWDSYYQSTAGGFIYPYSQVYVAHITTAGAEATGWTGGKKVFDGDPASMPISMYVHGKYMAFDSATGDIVVTWVDGRSSQFQTFGQRINSSGSLQWTVNGKLILEDSVTFVTYRPQFMRSVGDGFLLFVNDAETGPTSKQYVYKFDWSGNEIWGPLEVFDTNSMNNPTAKYIQEDDYTTLIYYVSRDGGSSNVDIFIQRIDNDGNLLFGSGNPVIQNTNPEYDTEVTNFISDNNGGYFVSWTDWSYDIGGNGYLFVQHIDSNGDVDTNWNSDGVTPYLAASDPYPQNIFTDGSGGVFMIWIDDDVGAINNQTVFIQHYDSGGNRLFNEDGLNTHVPSSQYELSSIPLYYDQANEIINIFYGRDYLPTHDYLIESLQIKHQIGGLDTSIDATNGSDDSLKLYSDFGSRSATEAVRLLDNVDNLVIADIDADLASSDIDWSTVNLDTDPSTKKTFVDSLTTAPGANTSYTMYVPKGASDTSVLVCPGAQSFSEINFSCSNLTILSGLTPITINSQEYWELDLLTTTGAKSFVGPNVPTITGSVDVTNGSEITATQPLFTFTTSHPASANMKYKIQIDDSSNFGSPIIEYTSDLSAAGSKSFTVGQAAGSGSYAVGSSGQNLSVGSYYWRVKAIDASDNESNFATAYSGGIAFKVIAPASEDETNDTPITYVYYSPTSTTENTTPSVSTPTTPATKPVTKPVNDVSSAIIFTIKVVDENNSPVADALVSIEKLNVQKKTDKDGIATFSGILDGIYVVKIEYDGVVLSKSINFEGGEVSSVQITRNTQTGSINFVAIILAIIAIGGISYVWYKKTQNKEDFESKVINN